MEKKSMIRFYAQNFVDTKKPKEITKFPCTTTPKIASKIAVPFVILFVAAAFLFFCHMYVSAQEFRSTISGRVTDQTGALIPGASIVVTEVQTNTVHKSITDNAGQYTVPFLLPGKYDVVANASGFGSSKHNNILLQAGDHPQIDITLSVVSSTQTVNVTAEAPLIDQTNASVQQVITTEQVAELPIDGRNPILLTQLSLGVLPTSNYYPSQAGAFGAGNGWSIGGTPQQTSEVLFDGTPDTTWSGNLAYSPTQDSIQEVSVSVFDTDAAFGHTIGGVINQISKQGTNQIHGSAYEYSQISALDANTFFNDRQHKPLPVTHYNQYGLTAGGPVYLPKIFNGRNKLFFFFSWEGIKDSQPATDEATVPTAAERTGDFSALLPLGCTSGYLNGNSAFCANGKANQYQLYNPYTAQIDSKGVITRQPIPGNILGNAGISLNSVAQKYLQFYPQANANGETDGMDNYISSAPSIDNYNNEFGRIDVNISDRSHLFGDVRHNLRSQTKNNYFANSATGSGLVRENYGITLDEVYTLNSSTVLDVRANWTSYNERHNAPSNALTPTTVGLPALTAASEFTQLPYIGFSGSCGSQASFQCLGDTGSGKDPTVDYQLLADVVKTIGKHTLKVGTDLRQYRVDVILYGDSAGSFTFGTNWVTQSSNATPPTFGGDFASFLMGLPTGGEFDQAARASYHSWYTAGFVQDDWRIKNNLTLNLGIRFDHDTPYEEKFGRVVNGFDSNATLPITAQAQNNYAQHPISFLGSASFNPVGGLTFPSSKNSGPYQTESHLFSPRIGFSYSPEKLKNTTIRGGFGMFVAPDTIATMAATGTYSSNPISNQEGFSSVTSLVATNDSYLTPAMTLDNPFPNGFTPVYGAAHGAATNIGQTINFMAPKEHDPYSLRWNLGIQHEFTSKILMEVAYIANRGVHIPVAATQLNPVPRQFLSTSDGRDQTLISSYAPSVTNPFAGLLPGTSLNGTTTSIPQLLAVHPQFPTSGQGFSSGVIEQNNTVGQTYFESGAIRLEKRLSGGLSLTGNYGFSKLIEADTYLNDTDSKLNRRVSPYDRTHHFVVAGTYALPYGKGRYFEPKSRLLDEIFGGFTLNGIYTYQSGAPVYFSTDIPVLPGHTYKEIKINKRQTNGPALNTTIFQTGNNSTNNGGQFQYHVRTLPQIISSVRQDGINNLDASMLKDFHFTNGTYFQLRFETYNTLNDPNFAAPAVTSATSSTFGVITSQANGSRAVQLGGRLVF
jgi:hypothetical protein